MRKVLSLVSIVMLFVGGLNAQAPTEKKTVDPNAPIIHFDETTLDY